MENKDDKQIENDSAKQNENEEKVEENIVVENEVVSNKKGELNEAKPKKSINWKRIGLIVGLFILIDLGVYVFGIFKLGWKLPNDCGFYQKCTEMECFKVWDCPSEEIIVEKSNSNDAAKINSKIVNTNSEVSESSSSKKEEIDMDNLEEISLGEINWLGKAEEVDYKIFTDSKEGICYRVANLENDRELYYLFYDMGVAANVFLRFVKDEDNIFVLEHKEFGSIFPGKDVFKDNVSIVLINENDYKKLEKDKEFEYENKVLEKKYDFNVFEDDGKYELLGEVDGRKFYRKYVFSENISDEFANRYLYILFEDGFLYQYNLKDEIMTDDRVPKITWIDGGRNDMSFEQRVHFAFPGFYSPIPVVIDGSGILSDKVKIGTLDIGGDVYQLKGTDNELVRQLWKSYDEVGGYSYGDEDVSVETIQEFNNQINHFLMQDIFGDWEIFVNMRFAPAAEMGKPVIYLYPEDEMKVDVKVGANITKSDPIYPEGGWRDVLAKPNGDLIYQNKNYESLFWEGMGDGGYEFLKDEGEVVRGTEIIQTVNEQMRQMGLNEKEIGDFMEFWGTRLPVNAEWVRLSWYQTEELNKMAPLYINPKPDTLIRVFLDWEAIEEYKVLKKQNLEKIERNGFTVVEWGGILFN